MADHPRTTLNMPIPVAFPLMIPNAQDQEPAVPQTVIVNQRVLDQLYGFLAAKGYGIDSSQGPYNSSLRQFSTWTAA